MVVTKREILFSIIIILVMLAMGNFIGEKIHDSTLERNELYYRAVKIQEDKEQFEYGMQTNIGNALVYGKITAVDTVSMPEIIGNFYIIEKNIERYTEHEDTEEYKDSDGNTQTRTVTTYSWDLIGGDNLQSNSFQMLGKEFSKRLLIGSERIGLNDDTVSAEYADRVHGGYIYRGSWFFPSVGDLRYSFSGVPKEFTGTLAAKLENNTVFSFDGKDSMQFLRGQNPNEVVQDLQDGEKNGVIIFWIFWIIFIAILVGVFMYFDNRWVEGR